MGIDDDVFRTASSQKLTANQRGADAMDSLTRNLSVTWSDCLVSPVAAMAATVDDPDQFRLFQSSSTASSSKPTPYKTDARKGATTQEDGH